MRKIYFYILASLSAALLLSSCGGKIGEMPADYFQVEPEVLELKAGKVEAVITAKFPEKFFAKKAALTITPVLVAENGKELEATPVKYQGEKYKANNTVIPYKEGAVVNQVATFEYDPDFGRSALYADLTVETATKEYKLPRVKLADGVITTSNLISGKDLTPWLASDKFQKTIQETFEAEIKFLIQQSNVRDSEKKAQSVEDFAAKIKETKETQPGGTATIDVQGYASPDGPEALNYRLAEQRQKNTVDMLKKMGGANFTTKFTAEDWDGFKQLVEASNIPDKGRILNVLSTYSDPEQREFEIKKMSSVYNQLAEDILPQLRRSKMKMTLEVMGKSDQEILNLLKSNASSLSADELLYGATLVNTNAEKAAAYQVVVNNYPNDWRGHNNLGCIKFMDGDIAAATTLFDKAFSMTNNATTSYNTCLSALANNDMAKASTQLANSKARGTSDKDLAEARAALQIYNGEYTAAATSVEGRNTNIAALAQLLSKNYTKATATLNAVSKPDATTYYMKAIIGARTNDKNQVISNLKTSAGMDAKKGQRAANDIEFAKYFTDSDFQAIAK